ncbi:MAG: hypothetical protein EAY75_08580 [Bacteroidetes bacterium]|nr:MAG: hypothetical protein EAY75_08580 [Bacteroidota bacterium]
MPEIPYRGWPAYEEYVGLKTALLAMVRSYAKGVTPSAERFCNCLSRLTGQLIAIRKELL